MNELTITKLRNGVWNFTEQAPGTAVDAYLVVGSERALMIDALQDVTGLYNEVRKLTNLPLGLALTHGHFDHAGASTQEFADAGCTIYMDMEDYPVLTGYSTRTFSRDIFTHLEDGRIFDLGGICLETVAVAGHTPGSVIFLDRTAKEIFSGDSFGSGPIWLQLPDSLPLSRYQANLERAMQKLSDIPELLLRVGHKNQSPEALGPSYLQDLLYTVKAVRDGSLGGETQEMEMRGVKFPFAIASHGKVLGMFYSPEHIKE